MYELELSIGVVKDLKKIKAYDRNIILDAIEKNLCHQPNTETRNRKMLVSLVPPFESVPQVWELRVGEYRVFYDVDEDEGKVFVRAVLRKPPHKPTEDIL